MYYSRALPGKAKGVLLPRPFPSTLYGEGGGAAPFQIKPITWPSWIAPALAHPVLDKVTLLQRQRGNVGRRGGATLKPGTRLATLRRKQGERARFRSNGTKKREKFKIVEHTYISAHVAIFFSAADGSIQHRCLERLFQCLHEPGRVHCAKPAPRRHLCREPLGRARFSHENRMPRHLVVTLQRGA